MNYNNQYFEERLPSQKDYYMCLQWLEWLRANKKIEGSVQIADYGCGTGKLTHVMNYFGASCVGYDPYLPDEIFGLAKHLCDKDWLESQMNAHKYQYYDLAICVDVLEHVKEPEIDEILERLKKTSKTVIFSICDLELWKRYADETHITCKTKTWWIKKIESHGFKYKEPSIDWLFREQLYIFEVIE